MLQKPKTNRKVSDTDVLRLNSLGLSLTTIGKHLDCHPSTITLRLQKLGVEPTDTRRSFMEDLINTMPADQQAWFSSQLRPNYSAREFVRDLLMESYLASLAPQPKAQNP